jgi:hypothetical protein
MQNADKGFLKSSKFTLNRILPYSWRAFRRLFVQDTAKITQQVFGMFCLWTGQSDISGFHTGFARFSHQFFTLFPLCKG